VLAQRLGAQAQRRDASPQGPGQPAPALDRNGACGTATHNGRRLLAFRADLGFDDLADPASSSRTISTSSPAGTPAISASRSAANAARELSQK
jgi:hypothetical protein